MLDMLDKLFGLGLIPKEWKQRIYSLLLAFVALLELFIDIPAEFAGEAFLMKVSSVIAVLAAFLLKLIRDRRESSDPLL